uniref:Regulatory protein E2 n=1 Tax=Rousettus bat papillomavirus TaxID=3141903 RepID=A0AAU7E3D6_9PAPI
MESLRDRLDVLQEAILGHVERQSNKIKDHVLYWALVRKECSLMYYARGKGIKNLGYYPLPVLSVSQERARQAQKVHLATQTLAKSRYRDEVWTLADLSLENFQCAPQDCFKKGGKQVEVVYDGDENNAFYYTLWDSIYVQAEDTTWYKRRGEVDKLGLFFMWAGEKRYYVKFEVDASTFSASSAYVVKTPDGELMSFVPVSSSTPDTGGHSERDFEEVPRKRRKTAAHLRSGDRGPRGPIAGASAGRGPRGGESEPDSAAPAPSQTQGEGAAEGSSGRLPSSLRPSAGQAAGRSGDTDRAYQAAPIIDPCIIIVGPANPLKCLRYRLQHQHFTHYKRITTTFQWLEAGHTERQDHAQIILRFVDRTQREEFLKRGALSDNVRYFLGDMPFLS